MRNTKTAECLEHKELIGRRVQVDGWTGRVVDVVCNHDAVTGKASAWVGVSVDAAAAVYLEGIWHRVSEVKFI